MNNKIRNATLTLGVALVAFSIGCASPPSEGPGPSKPVDSPAAKPAAIILSCKSGEFNSLDIQVKVDNKTKQQHSFLITAEALDAGGNRLGEANGAVNSLSGGSSTTVKLLGNMDSPNAIDKCRIADFTVS